MRLGFDCEDPCSRISGGKSDAGHTDMGANIDDHQRIEIRKTWIIVFLATHQNIFVSTKVGAPHSKVNRKTRTTRNDRKFARYTKEPKGSRNGDATDSAEFVVPTDSFEDAHGNALNRCAN